MEKEGRTSFQLDLLPVRNREKEVSSPSPPSTRWGWASRVGKSPRQKEKTLVLHLDDLDGFSSTTTDKETNNPEKEKRDSDEDTMTTEASEWSDWEDPRWVKDENLKKPGRRKIPSWSGLNKILSSPMSNTTTSTNGQTKKKRRSKSLKARKGDRDANKNSGLLAQTERVEKKKKPSTLRKKADEAELLQSSNSNNMVEVRPSSRRGKGKAIRLKGRPRRNTIADKSDTPLRENESDQETSGGRVVRKRAVSEEGVRSSWEEEEEVEHLLDLRNSSFRRNRSVSVDNPSMKSVNKRMLMRKENREKEWHLRHSGTFRFYKSLSGSAIPTSSVMRDEGPPLPSPTPSPRQEKEDESSVGVHLSLGDDWNDITLSLRKDLTPRKGEAASVNISEQRQPQQPLQSQQPQHQDDEQGEGETTLVKRSTVTVHKGAVTFHKKCKLTVIKTEDKKGRVELKVEKIVRKPDCPPEKKFAKTLSWDNIDLSSGGAFKQKKKSVAHSDETSSTTCDLLGSPSPVRLVDCDEAHRIKDVIQYYQKHQIQGEQATPSRTSQDCSAERITLNATGVSDAQGSVEDSLGVTQVLSISNRARKQDATDVTSRVDLSKVTVTNPMFETPVVPPKQNRKLLRRSRSFTEGSQMRLRVQFDEPNQFTRPQPSAETNTLKSKKDWKVLGLRFSRKGSGATKSSIQADRRKDL